MASGNVAYDQELLSACRNKSDAEVRTLVAKGANPRCTSDMPLCVAASCGRLSLVQWFVDEKNSDVNAWDGSPLRHAAYYGSAPVVSFLIEKGADVSLKNHEALRLAVKKNNFLVVNQLTNNGSDLSCLDDNDLLSTSSSGQVEMVRLVLTNGQYSDVGLNVAFKHARLNGHAKVLIELITHGVVDSELTATDLLSACISGNAEMIEVIKNHGEITPSDIRNILHLIKNKKIAVSPDILKAVESIS